MSGRVLIAGCGDVGARVAIRLQAQGRDVTALRRTPRPPATGIDVHVADLTDPGSLSALPGDVTSLVYLPTPDTRTPEAYRAVFVDGLRHLLSAIDAGQLERVVFVSSSAVHGDHGGDWVDEDTPPAPPGFNGEALWQAERWLAAQALPATVLRLAGLYGPGRTRLFERLRAGEAHAPRRPPFWSNRIHVDDAAAAIVHVLRLQQPAPLYLGVDSTPLPQADLYGHIAAYLGAPVPPDGPPPPGIGNKRLSNARLRASGFAFAWPDARRGYDVLIGDAEGRGTG